MLKRKRAVGRGGRRTLSSSRDHVQLGRQTVGLSREGRVPSCIGSCQVVVDLAAGGRRPLDRW